MCKTEKIQKIASAVLITGLSMGLLVSCRTERKEGPARAGTTSSTAQPLPSFGLGTSQTAGPLPESIGQTTSAPRKGAADNSRCYVCHFNFQFEKLASTHANAGVGCADCHGPSDAHIADESWSWGGKGTPPDRMYPREKINSACIKCHQPDRLPSKPHAMILAHLHQTKQVCTDCHGKHRLAHRKVHWR